MKIDQSSPLSLPPTPVESSASTPAAPADQSAPLTPATTRRTRAARTPAPATPSANPTSHKSKINRILRQAGLPTMTVKAPPATAAAQARLPGNRISFEKALDLALGSILTDQSSAETPVSLFENEFYGENYTDELVKFLNAPGTTLALVNGDEPVEGAAWYPAEDGESIEQNWIFSLSIPSFSDHLFWAVVPRNGEAPFSYGFN